jgi:hypothetical protein
MNDEHRDRVRLGMGLPVESLLIDTLDLFPNSLMHLVK